MEKLDSQTKELELARFDLEETLKKRCQELGDSDDICAKSDIILNAIEEDDVRTLIKYADLQKSPIEGYQMLLINYIRILLTLKPRLKDKLSGINGKTVKYLLEITSESENTKIGQIISNSQDELAPFTRN